MSLRKIMAVYIDENGKKTEDQIVIEILVKNNKEDPVPDFKGKSEMFGYCKWLEEETQTVGTYPFLATFSKDILLLDFGDAWLEENETPISPKGGRYIHVLTKNFGTSAGKEIVMQYAGLTHPFQITKVTNLSIGAKCS